MSRPWMLLLLLHFGAACERGRCGAGTVDMGRTCEAVLACGAGTTQRGELCVAEEEVWGGLPFPAGNEFVVTQGNHGYYSHYYYDSYAIDFSMAQGEEVAALRAGVVLDLKEDSDRGCASEACAEDANYLVVDHGDATFGVYLHLEQDGVLVARGDLVGQGEVVARSGNTGFSSGPHLHVQVNDLFGQSLPLRFEDLAEHSGGVAYPGGSFTAEGSPQDPPDGLDPSVCPEHTFAFMGVRVEPGVPCAHVQPGERSALRGQVLLDGAQLQVATWSDTAGTWLYRCHTPDADGRFEVEHTWDEADYQAQSWLMLAAADEGCYSYQSWSSSVAIGVW